MAYQQNIDGSFTHKGYASTDAPIKRRLSITEKSTVLNTSCSAVTLAGRDWCEYEELSTIGFDPNKIYGFEKDPETRRALREKYPFALVKDGYIQDRLVKVFDYKEISYLHLDYEQTLLSGTGGHNSSGNIFFAKHPNWPDSNRRFVDLFDDNARLRITSCASPRGAPASTYIWAKNIAYYYFLQACEVHDIEHDLFDAVTEAIDYFFAPVGCVVFDELNGDYKSRLKTRKSYAHINFAMFLVMHLALPRPLSRHKLININIDDLDEHRDLMASITEVRNVKNITSEFYKKTDTTKSSPMFTGWCDVGADMVPFNEFLTDIAEYIVGQQLNVHK